MNTYISLLHCDDRPGIVKALATAVADIGGNILENDQFSDPVTGRFGMRTRFTADDRAADDVRQYVSEALAHFRPDVTMRVEEDHRRAIIMVSKYDHCLAELIYRHQQGDLPLDIVAVVANHDDLRSLVEGHGIPFHYVPVTPATKAHAEAILLGLVEELRVDFVILARYMQILSAELVAALPERIVNIHHSFLPGFKGAKPYHQAYERGVKLIGATAHFVTADLDEGPIIEQDVTRVTHARSADDLVAIGRDVERRVLSHAVRLLAQDRVLVAGHRTIVFQQ